MSTPSTQILASKYHALKKKKKGIQDSREKWLIPGMGQKAYKVSLECLDAPESKEGLREGWGPMGETQAGQTWDNLSINNEQS